MERWLIGILLALLTVNMSFVNYTVIKELRKPLCVLDIQKFINFMSSQTMNEKEADFILAGTKDYLESLGCKAIFVKGALITGSARDITGEVIRYVKDLHSKAAK